MTTTAALGLTQLEAGQANAHVTVNEALAGLDAAVAGRLAVDVSAGGTIALTAAQALYAQINLYGSPAAAFTVTIPARPGHWVVVNDTDKACTFKTAAGIGQVVPEYSSAHLLCDTANVVDVRSAFTQNVVIVDGKHLQTGTTTGSKIGTDVAQKLAFWNATPVVQPAHADQAAVTQTAGGTYTATEQAMLEALKTLVNQLRADLVAVGLIKGSA